MYGALIKVVAKPGKRGELIEFLRWDAAVALPAEPGTLRFDAWDVPGDPDAVYMYEAYASEDAFAEHKRNAPYARYVGHVTAHLLDNSGEQRLVEFTESLVSNADVMWNSRSVRVAPEAQTESRRESLLTKLSFGSFPPDGDASEAFTGYAELRRLTSGRDASVAHVHFPPGVRTHWHVMVVHSCCGLSKARGRSPYGTMSRSSARWATSSA